MSCYGHDDNIGQIFCYVILWRELHDKAREHAGMVMDAVLTKHLSAASFCLPPMQNLMRWHPLLEACMPFWTRGGFGLAVGGCITVSVVLLHVSWKMLTKSQQPRPDMLIS